MCAGQVVLHQMLMQWGWDGLDKHCKSIQSFYRNLADTFHETALKELAGLAEWHRPEVRPHLTIHTVCNLCNLQASCFSTLQPLDKTAAKQVKQ